VLLLLQLHIFVDSLVQLVVGAIREVLLQSVLVESFVAHQQSLELFLYLLFHLGGRN
jgi:hypothetical protein